jgi:hypothetical protein
MASELWQGAKYDASLVNNYFIRPGGEAVGMLLRAPGEIMTAAGIDQSDQAAIFFTIGQPEFMTATAEFSFSSSIQQVTSEVKGAGNVAPAAESEAAAVANPRNLLSRQGPAEMTGNKIKRLASDMEANGFDPAHPIEVANVEGRQVIIDGHHRAAAAIRANIQEVPITVTPVSPAQAAKYAEEAAEAAAQRSLYRP